MEERSSLYTQSELFEDILEELHDCDTNSREGEMLGREFRHNLKVFQTICNLNYFEYDFLNDNSEKIKTEIKTKIKVQVDNDELLFGYTFFLSLNSKFDCSWNYLRRQMEQYMDFLYDAYKFISYVVFDINSMKSKFSAFNELHIEFNELFDVKFINVAPYVKTVINWKNFHQISKVKNGYYVIAKYDETTLLTYLRRYNERPDSFVEEVNKRLISWNEQMDKTAKI